MERNAVIEEDLKFITDTDLPWQKLEGKTVFVSGANGFLPSYLVETILYLNETRFQNKARVIALVRDMEKAKNRFAAYTGREDLKFIVQDVCDPIQVEGSVDFVIHAASQASPKFYGKDPVGTLSANVIGTRQLLELAQTKKIEVFLFISSSEVYGQISNDQTLIHETMFGTLDPMEVRSCYAESKRLGETMCVSWMSQFKVPVKIARPFHTYGPGMKFDDGRVHTDFVYDIVHNRNIVMKSDGAAVRAFCYIADVAKGLFTVLLKGEPGEAYNVGNPEGAISIAQLAELLVDLVPDRKLKVEKKEAVPEGYIKSKVSWLSPDIGKIQKLGWSPAYPPEDGFERTLRSLG